MQSITTILALFYYSLRLSQSLDPACSQSCYDISLTSSPEFRADLEAYCYSYSVTLSDDASCNSDIASTTILFGIDPAQCSPNSNDLASKIVATDPFNHIIHDDPTNIKGIEFSISSIPITICIKGTDGQTMIGPLVLEDASNQCLMQNYADLPDICGICDGDEADSTCFCQSTAAECETANRPRGDLVCSWDTSNGNECIAITPPECEQDMLIRPCECFWSQNECEGIAAEGPRDCDWDDLREMCLPIDCIGDDLECRCLSFQQDCESEEIVDFPAHCMWTENENCTETTTTLQPSTTEETTTTEEITTTGCVDHCGCFKTAVECNGDIEELRCVWVDECVEATTTTADLPEISTTEDVMTTTGRTRPPRTTSTTWSTGTSTTRRKTSTTWSKTTKSKDCDDDKDKDKDKGKNGSKGGKKGSGGN